jgi:DNA-binding LacI/PurR family transcriptional regulator
MKMIAQELGVSTMTVSLALKGHSRISDKTREKVKKKAEEMGYCSNPMVSSLMAHIRSSRPVPYQANLAIFSDFERRDGWKSFHFIRQAFEGIEKRAKEQGFLIDHFWLHQEGMQGERIKDILASRNIQGVILGPLAESGTLDHLDWSQWCSAALGDSLVSPRLHRVTHHQFHGMEVILENLERKGYQRIGLVVDTLSDRKVGHAWSSYMTGYHLRIPARNRVPVHVIPENAGGKDREKLAAWLEKQRPDVLIGHDGPLYWLRELGVRIPDDVAFAHLSLPSHFELQPAVTFSGLDQNWRQVGAASVDLVVAQIYRNERGMPQNPKTILLEGFWVDGATTPEK